MFVADGSFLVDGILNTVYKIKGSRRKIMQEGAEAAYVESDWRHAVAVRNGRVFDNHLVEEGEPPRSFGWIQRASLVNMAI